RGQLTGDAHCLCVGVPRRPSSERVVNGSEQRPKHGLELWGVLCRFVAAMDERQLRQHQCTMTRQELTSLVEEISATRGRGLDHPARGNPWRLEPPLYAGVETLEDEPEDSQHVLAPETAHHGRDRLQSSPRSSKLFVG